MADHASTAVRQGQGRRISARAVQVHYHEHCYALNFSPAIPTRINAIQAMRSEEADSPISTMPRMTLPAAPIPVQTA